MLRSWLWGIGALVLLAPEVAAAEQLVTGKALLPNGKPAAGARVWVGWTDGGRQHGLVEGEADARGQFRLPASIPAVPLVVVGGVARGAAPTLQRLSQSKPKTGTLKSGKAPSPLTLKLAAPVTLSGRLLSADGKPAAGVPFGVDRFVPPATTSGVPGPPHPWAYAQLLVPQGVRRELVGRSGADGRFQWTGLPARTRVGWVLGGGVVLSQGTPQVLRLGAPGQQELGTLIVTRLGGLEARVETPEGKPVPDATVSVRRSWPLDPEGPLTELQDLLLSPLRDDPMTGVTDPRGLARFDGLQPGDYEVAIAGRVFPARVREGKRDEPVRLETRNEPFTGRVVDAAGQAVAGARVGVEIRHTRRNWPPCLADPVATGPDGRFSMAQFPWEAEEVVLRAVAGTGMTEQVLRPRDLKAPPTLSLRSGVLALVRGRVLDGGGKPVSQTQVLLIHRGPDGTRPIGLGRTDPEGRFTFDALKGGVAFFVGLAVQGQLFESREYRTPPQGELDLGDVRMAPARPPAAPAAPTANLADAFALLPLSDPEALSGARAAAAEYLQATRAGDLAGVHALTSPLTPGYSPDRATFLRQHSLLLPPEAAGLTAEKLHPIPLVPRLLWGALLGVDPASEAGQRLRTALARSAWALVGYRGGVGVNVLLVVHRERGAWKVVGGLLYEPIGLSSVKGDGALFGVSYAAPAERPILAVARKYLAAWKTGDLEAMRLLTHPSALEHAPDRERFAEGWKARPEGGVAPQADPEAVRLETRFSRWDLAFLFTYPRLLAQVRSAGDPPATAPANFPLPEIEGGRVAVVRYPRQGGMRLMLLIQRMGHWEVFEPGVDLTVPGPSASENAGAPVGR